MRKIRVLLGLLALCLLCALPAAAETMSDEEFFGRWEDGAIAVPSVLDYEGTPALETVESWAKEGNYVQAKQALLAYFVERKQNGRIKAFPVTEADENKGQADLAIDSILTGPFEFDTQIGQQEIGMEEGQIAFSVTEQVRQAVENQNISFLLMAAEKEEQAAYFGSRESETPPVLRICSGKEVYDIPADRDTSVSAGEKDKNFGKEKQLEVCEQSSVIDEPYGNRTRRAYLNFPLDYFSAPIDSATLYLTGISEKERKGIHLIQVGDTVWGEDTLTWAKIPGNIYSWQSNPAGPVWETPEGADSEYTNVTARFWFAKPMAWEYLKDSAGNEIYGKKVLELMNAFAQKKQPGFNRVLETGERLNRWTDVFDTLVDTPVMTPKYCCEIVKFMYLDCNSLIENKDLGWSNWKIVRTAGLYKAVAYFPEFKSSASWLQQTTELAGTLLSELYAEDFSFTEGAGAYDVWCVELFSNVARMAKLNGLPLPESYLQRLYAIGCHALEAMYPNGYDTNVGDSNYVNKQQVFQGLAELYHDDIFLVCAGETQRQPEWLSSYYACSGEAFMRSGWEPDTAVYVNYQNNRNNGHAHPDLNQVLLYAYGSPLLVDSGRYTYSTQNDIYTKLRTPEFHNTISVDGLQMNSPDQYHANAEPFSEWASNAGFDYARAAQRGYPGVEHTRSVLFVHQGLVFVSDQMRSEEVQTYRQNWHFMPGSNAVKKNGTFKTAFKDRANVLLSAQGYDRADLSDTYFSANYGLAAQNKSAAYTKTGRNAVIDTVLYPVPSKEQEMLLTEKIEVDGAQAMKVTTNRENGVYFHTFGEPSLKLFENYAFDGQALYASANEICMTKGKNFGRDGRNIISSQVEIPDLNLRFQQGQLWINGAAIEPCKDPGKAIRIWAPGVQQVFVNGEEVEITWENSFIYAAAVKTEQDTVSVQFTDQKGTEIAPGEKIPAAGHHIMYTQAPEWIVNEKGIYKYCPETSQTMINTTKQNLMQMRYRRELRADHVVYPKADSFREDGLEDGKGTLVVSGGSSFTRRNAVIQCPKTEQKNVKKAVLVLKVTATANCDTELFLYHAEPVVEEKELTYQDQPVKKELIQTEMVSFGDNTKIILIDVTPFVGSDSSFILSAGEEHGKNGLIEFEAVPDLLFEISQ